MSGVLGSIKLLVQPPLPVTVGHPHQGILVGLTPEFLSYFIRTYSSYSYPTLSFDRSTFKYHHVQYRSYVARILLKSPKLLRMLPRVKNYYEENGYSHQKKKNKKKRRVHPYIIHMTQVHSPTHA